MFSDISGYFLNIIKNLSIGIKLTTCYLIVIAVFVVFAVASYSQLKGIGDEISSLDRSSQNRNTVQSLSELSRDEYINSINMIADVGSGMNEEGYLAQIKKISGEFGDT